MNIDDAVCDYSDAFDISPYVNNIKQKWNDHQMFIERSSAENRVIIV